MDDGPFPHHTHGQNALGDGISDKLGVGPGGSDEAAEWRTTVQCSESSDLTAVVAVLKSVSGHLALTVGVCHQLRDGGFLELRTETHRWKGENGYGS